MENYEGNQEFAQTKARGFAGIAASATILIFAALVALFCLSGCNGEDRSKPESIKSESAALSNVVEHEPGDLVSINNSLAYDVDTHIIYYCFEEEHGRRQTGFMSPYYGENGGLCRYENGEIVEIPSNSNDLALND